MNMWVSIIPLVVVLALIWFCVRSLRHAVSTPSRRDGTAKCGKCGYEISDLSFDRCPECGGKLLEVGIVTPSLIVRRESSVAGLIGSWTLAVFMTSIISFFVIAAIWSALEGDLPIRANTDLQKTHLYIPMRQLQSQPYRFDLALDIMTNASADIRTGTIEIVITHPDNTESSLTLNAITLQVLRVDGEDAQAPLHEFSMNDAMGMYRSAGLDATDAMIIYEAGQLFNIITEVANDPFGDPDPSRNVRGNASQGLKRLVGSSTETSAPPAPIFAGLNSGQLALLIGVGLWLIIYIVGLRLMLLGRKRALQETA